MSPLWRYYGALTAFVADLILGNIAIDHLPRSAQGPAIGLTVIIGFGTYAYAMFVRCPNCRKRLQERRTAYSRGIPGRLCPKCGRDLHAVEK